VSLVDYNAEHGRKLGIEPSSIGASSWLDVDAIKRWQSARGLLADGWFGPQSVAAYQAVITGGSRANLVIFGLEYAPASIAHSVYHASIFAARERKRGTTINSLILHQSVTSSRQATERTFAHQGYGVHLLIEPDGTLHSYGDLGMTVYAHGNERNGTSLAIELVNPYATLMEPWTTMIDPSPTAWRNREVEDTPEALTTLNTIVRFLTSHEWQGPGDRAMRVPLAWPTTSLKRPTKSHAAWYDLTQGGIIAHGHRPSIRPDGKHVTAHADARRTAWLLRRGMQTAV